MAHQLVNLNQSAEERQQKYWLCRSLGLNSSWSRTMRDWPAAKLERRLHLVFDCSNGPKRHITPYAQLCLPSFPLIYFKSQNPLDDALQYVYRAGND